MKRCTWFRRFLSLDPREYLQRVTCPVLALAGERDLQVPPSEYFLIDETIAPSALALMPTWMKKLAEHE